MIPKIASFYWSGAPLSFMRWATLATFRKLNPSWTIRLYSSEQDGKCEWRTGEQQEFIEYNGPDYSDRVEELGVERIDWRLDYFDTSTPVPDVNPVHACDFFRWWALYTTGGFCIDMDILFVRPMDNFYSRICWCDTGVCVESGHASIGFLFSARHNSLWRDIYRNCFRFYDPAKYQCVGSDAIRKTLEGVAELDSEIKPAPVKIRTCRGFLSALRNRYPESTICSISNDIVYPWSCRQAPAIFDSVRSRLPRRTVGIHWFAGHPRSQEMNRTITLENFRNYPYQNTWLYHANRIVGQDSGNNRHVH